MWEYSFKEVWVPDAMYYLMINKNTNVELNLIEFSTIAL